MLRYLVLMFLCVISVHGTTNCPASLSNEYYPVLTWSSWSPCDQPCGGGIKTRVGTCTFYYYYIRWQGISRQVNINDRIPCNEICTHGHFNSSSCHCPPGIKGRCCEVAPVCKTRCENGGTCIADDTCKCQPGLYGQWCEIGSDFDEKLKPKLNTTVPLNDAYQFMSWYNAPDVSDYNRACYVKVHVQNAARDTLVRTESTYSDGKGQLFGTYSGGPIDEHGQLNGTSRFSCQQVKCPGSSLNGTRINVYINVTVTSRYKVCVLRTHALGLSGFSQGDASNSFGFTFEEGHNYGSAFGIYTGMGFRDMANHIARQSCFSGRRFDLTHMNPFIDPMAKYMCS